MTSARNVALVIGCSAAVGLASLIIAPVSRAGAAQGRTQQASATGAARPVGTVKAVSGDAITLATDGGAEVKVIVQDSTRILRSAPGQKDLKDAVPIRLPEVQVGDRMLVRGRVSDDQSVLASSIVVMKQTDIAQKQQREREDWQRRGVGGLVSAIDPAAGTISLATTAAGGNPVVVRINKDTIIRRYAPESVKFDDAKPGTLDQIKPGDQLRARGTRTSDGLVAEEIVSGSFRNIAGTIASIDPDGNTISVMDLATKKPVVVKITADSQLRKLPPMVAQGIAMRLKGAAPSEGAAGGGPQGASQRVVGERSPAAASPGEERMGANGEPLRHRGAPDLQQMLNRVTVPVTLADFQKGEAVMIVTTPGAGSSGVTAITLLTGVEPILTAPGSRAAMLLSPWNLSGGAGGEVE